MATPLAGGRFGLMSLNAVVCADQQACPVTRPRLLHPWLQLGTMENTIGVAYLKCNPPDQVPVSTHLVRRMFVLSPGAGCLPSLCSLALLPGLLGYSRLGCRSIESSQIHEAGRM